MIDFFSRSLGISMEQATAFAAGFERKSFKKGALFLKLGQTCNAVGFVETGLLKCSLVSEDKTAVDDFIFENQFVANYYSFLKNTPSNKEIACLKDSTIHVIHREQLAAMSKELPFLEEMARKVSEQLFLTTAEKLEDLKMLSAEERYLKLIRNHPNYVNDIPQYEIASFLNVSPETLSRIRKNIAVGS